MVGRQGFRETEAQGRETTRPCSRGSGILALCAELLMSAPGDGLGKQPALLPRKVQLKVRVWSGVEGARLPEEAGTILKMLSALQLLRAQNWHSSPYRKKF